MQKITSKENEFIKHIKKLKDKKYRDQSNEYIIEGIKLIQEAIQEKAQIHQIVICEDCEKSGIISQELKYEIAKQECVYVPQNIFKTISEVSTPQGILAIVEKNNIKNKDSEIDYNQDIIVALDDIQDPGNLGTILRTVDSIGLKQILVSSKLTDWCRLRRLSSQILRAMPNSQVFTSHSPRKVGSRLMTRTKVSLNRSSACTGSWVKKQR